MEREDLKVGRNKKSFRDIYLQAEKYRQGLSVEMDKDTFAASENDTVSKIYRAKDADISFEGIKLIHAAR